MEEEEGKSRFLRKARQGRKESPATLIKAERQGNSAKSIRGRPISGADGRGMRKEPAFVGGVKVHETREGRKKATD